MKSIFSLIFFRIPRILIILWLRVLTGFYSRAMMSIALGSGANSASPKKIVFNTVEMNHPQSHQFVGLAFALKRAGHTVEILRCTGDLNRCEIKSVRNHLLPCLECKIFSSVIPRIFSVDVVDFLRSHRGADRQSFGEGFIDDEKSRAACHESIVRRYYGAQPATTSKQYASEMAEELLAYNISLLGFRQAIVALEPDVVVGNMNVYSTWAPHYRYALEHSLPYRMISATAYSPTSVVLDRHVMYESPQRFADWEASRLHRALNGAEGTSLDHFLEKRREGADPVLKKYAYAASLALPQRSASQKKAICFYSNIYWDIGLVKLGHLFEDVIDWLIQSVEYIHSCDPSSERFSVLIKVHPAESLDVVRSERGIESVLADLLPSDVFRRITFIRPEDGVSPYVLASHVDINVVYNGSIGLELLACGKKNVLIGGPAPYLVVSGQGEFSMADYLGALVGSVSLPDLDFERARLFAYFYLIGQCVEWPYTSRIYGSSLFSYRSVPVGDGTTCNHIERWICE